MSSPKEFREFAHECVRWANETTDEHERQALLDLAKQWTHAALAAERLITLIEDNPPLVPKGNAAR